MFQYKLGQKKIIHSMAIWNRLWAEYVSDDHAVIFSYIRDISTHSPSKPQGTVVRPGFAQEVVELVRYGEWNSYPLDPYERQSLGRGGALGSLGEVSLRT